MPTLRVYWNSVDVLDSGNLKQLTGNQKAKSVNCNYGCKGVVFRTILRQEMDFGGYLNSFSLETDRKSRDAGDTKLLFCPKPETEKSIGVLRIVKPKRFTSRSAAASYLEGSGQVAKVSLDPTSRADTVREFEILLESTDFILEDAQEQMAEKFQLQETFGDFNVFFFGRRAEIFTYSGTLVNAGKDLAWRNNFLYNYENYLRGTKCAELKARAYLLYDDVVREGFILSAAVSQNSTVEAAVKFTFTLLVTGKRILTAAPENVAKSDFVEVTDVKSITPEDFEFVRSTRVDGGLSWVSPPVTGGAEEIFVSNCFMMENTSIEGAVPASDLQQAIINRSLEAIKASKTEELASEDDQVLDYEVLIDFVTAKQLAGLATTSRQIAGKKSSDVENLSGEVIVAQLLSGDTTVDDLRLRDAVKAADSIAKQYDSTLGSASTELRRLAQYFTVGENSGAQGLRLPKLGPSVDYQQSVAPLQGQKTKRYVLSPDLDSSRIVDIIGGTRKIAGFNPGLVNKQVVDSVKVSSLKTFLSETKNREIAEYLKLYAAAFCLIGDPRNAGTLFAQVTDAFSGAAAFTEPNAAIFVENQKVRNFIGLLKSLPAEVDAALKSCFSQLDSSPLANAINVMSGVSGGKVWMGEGVLRQATAYGQGNTLSRESAKYIGQVGSVVSGMLAERFNVTTKTTTDLVAGTVKTGVGNNPGVYFTKTYTDSLAPDASAEAGPKVIMFGDKSTKLSSLPVVRKNNGIFLFLPYLKYVYKFVVAVQYRKGGATTREELIVDGDTLGALGFGAGELDALKAMLSSGIAYLTNAQVQIIESSERDPNGARIYYEVGTKRSGAPSIPEESYDTSWRSEWVADYPTGFSGIAGQRLGDARKVRCSGVTELFKRNYLGGTPIRYIVPTVNLIRDAVSVVGEKAKSGADPVASEAEKALMSILENPASVDKFGGKEAILKDLALKNFSDIPSIVGVDLELKYTGVRTEDYFNMAFMAESQKEMVGNLTLLKNSLSSAAAKLRAGKTESATVVRGADGQEQEVSCG